MALSKLALPAWVTPAGIMATLKWVLVGVLLWQVSGVARDYIKDQKTLRDSLVENSVERRIAEAQVVQLQQAVTEQQQAAERQAEALAQATQAIQALNGNFNRYRAEQQKLERTLHAANLAQQAAVDPTAAAQDATTLSQQLQRQFEELYP